MRHAKVVVTLTAVLMVVAMASAQTPRQAASTDTVAVEALTAEIRALRAELAESARTGLRLQLLDGAHSGAGTAHHLSRSPARRGGGAAREPRTGAQ